MLWKVDQENLGKLEAKPILVTGSHRSGSTWTGKVISSSRSVGYIHEPFSPITPKWVNPNPFDVWFQYLCNETGENFCQNIRNILEFKCSMSQGLKNRTESLDIARMARDCLYFFYHRQKHSRALMKDPIAVFSAEWLCENFNMDIIVLIRHPAAFASSLKIKNWQFNFNNFLKQPLLIKERLSEYEVEIENYCARKYSIINQAILLWNCIHHVINEYRKKHPEWIFIRHEDLSLDPMGSFEKIFSRLKLDFEQTVIKKIKKSSSQKNPVEQKRKKEFMRNSKKNIFNWKNRLTKAEIGEIKERTASLSSLFYSESDW